MRARIGLASFALFVLCGTGRAAAEPAGSYGYLIPTGGYTLFDGNLSYPTAPLKDAVNFGGRLGWQQRPWVAWELAGGFTPTQENVTNGADVDYIHASGNVVFSPVPGLWGGPFASVGFGAARLKPTTGGFSSTTQGNLEAAGGLNLWITDRVGTRLEGRDLIWLDKEKATTIHAHDWLLSAGIVVALGAKPRDTDGDGVPDRKDRCPDTPKGAVVDAIGCPKDTDGDGVLDGIDLCPNTPKGAVVDARGCPHDADGDSVFDGIDLCPDTPKGAIVDSKGCPTDADSDGVFDGIDQCPNTPRGAVVDEKGCPKDADGDGVPDGIDKCPDTAAGLKVDQDGCPVEVKEKEQELMDTGMIRLQDLDFEDGKATLLPEALPRLAVVGQVLTKWPQLKIEIGVHTDDRGDTKANQKLSEARAQAVASYVEEKAGLKPDQFVVKGYGESRPLVPNTNDLSRSKNRRVEFVVLNKDVLKREIESRHTQPSGEGAQPATPGNVAPPPGAPPPPSPAPPDTTRK